MVNDDVLEVMVRDYEIARAEERQHLSLQGVLLTLWLTGVGVLGVFAKAIQDHQANGASGQYPQYMIAVAPSLILCLGAFTHWIGTQAVVRGLYMRALERRIRERLALVRLDEGLGLGCFEGLPALTGAEFAAEVSGMRSGRSMGQHVRILLMVTMALFFGGFVYYLMGIVDYSSRWFMVAFYGGLGTLIVVDNLRVTLHSRSYFFDLTQAVRRRLDTPLDQDPSAPKASGRSLWSYLVLPRPDEVVKALFTLAGFLVGCFLGDSVAVGRALWMGLWTFVCVELLAYQARYQVNDILGAAEDSCAPSAASRGRLPAEKGAAAASRLVAGIRVVVAVYIVLHVYDAGWHAESRRLGFVCLAVFALACVYENWRFLSRKSKGSGAGKHWGLVFLVTQGYPLRTLGGMLVMPGWQGEHGVAYIGTWVAATGLGLVFIVPTWILQAFDYVKFRASGNSPVYGIQRAEGKGHLVWLAAVHGWKLREGVSGDKFEGPEARVLLKPPCRVPGWAIGNAIYIAGCWLVLWSLGILPGWPLALYGVAAVATLINPGESRVVGIWGLLLGRLAASCVLPIGDCLIGRPAVSPRRSGRASRSLWRNSCFPSPTS